METMILTTMMKPNVIILIQTLVVFVVTFYDLHQHCQIRYALLEGINQQPTFGGLHNVLWVCVLTGRYRPSAAPCV